MGFESLEGGVEEASDDWVWLWVWIREGER